MSSVKNAIRPYWVAIREMLIDMPRWYLRGQPAPAPRRIKNAVLAANAPKKATWVETGTYLGQTTQFLSGIASHVYSLEPANGLFQRAHRKFFGRSDVTIMNQSSEEAMPTLLATINGPTAFWLDGHFSDGATYQGGQVTPIAQELAAIDANFERLSPMSVMVDDIRLFGTDPGYPSVAVLTDWAAKHGMSCKTEHDILIMRTR